MQSPGLMSKDELLPFIKVTATFFLNLWCITVETVETQCIAKSILGPIKANAPGGRLIWRSVLTCLMVLGGRYTSWAEYKVKAWKCLHIYWGTLAHELNLTIVKLFCCRCWHSTI